MAIGGANNDPYKLNSMGLFKNTGPSAARQAGGSDSVKETDDSSSARNTSSRAADLAASLRPDGFGSVSLDKLAATAGATAVNKSSPVNQSQGITGTSALGEPSSVSAIDNTGIQAMATDGNSGVAFGNTQLALFARLAKAETVNGDFDVSRENSSTRKGNDILAAAVN